MAAPFKFSIRQRFEHSGQLAIDLDAKGNEILCGLTLEETKECLVMDSQFDPDVDWSKDVEERYTTLIKRHWAERKRRLRAMGEY